METVYIETSIISHATARLILQSSLEAQMTKTNPILEELYAARAQIMAQHGNDLGAYLRDAAKRTQIASHPIAKIKQRTIRCGGEVVKSDKWSVKDLSPPPAER